MKQKIIAITFSLLLLTSIASGCSSAKGEDIMLGAAGESQNASMDMATTEMAPMEPEMMEEFGPVYHNSNATATISQNKKIIKNGSLDMTAKDVEEAYGKLLQYVQAKGGYEFSRNLQGNSSYKSMSVVFKVPPTELDGIMAYAGDCGDVINTRTSTDNITADYTDVEIRLNTKKKALEKYYGFLANATTMEEIIMLQQQIDQLTADIESYEERLRLWNSQISESTLEVLIQQEDDPDKIPEDIEWDSISLSTMGKMMKNGFVSVINGIISVFQWLIIAIVTASPIIIPVVIIVILIVRKARKKKAVKEKPAVTEK